LSTDLLIGHGHAEGPNEQGCVVFLRKVEDRGCRSVKESIIIMQPSVRIIRNAVKIMS